MSLQSIIDMVASSIKTGAQEIKTVEALFADVEPAIVAVVPSAAPALAVVNAVVAAVAPATPAATDAAPLDNAGIAAAGIAASAAPVDTLAARIAALESGLLALLPVIQTIGKELGL